VERYVSASKAHTLTLIDTDLPQPPEHTHIMLDFAASWVEIPEVGGDRYYQQDSPRAE